jgi:hypothetical protein
MMQSTKVSEIDWNAPEAFIGSSAFPTLSCVQEAVGKTREAFTQFTKCKKQDRFLYWNLASLHVLWHQQFAIGMRCSRRLYIQLSEVSESGLATLSDKDYKNGYKTRLVWLPPSLRLQMKELEKHAYYIVRDRGTIGRPRHRPFSEPAFLSDPAEKANKPIEIVSRDTIRRISNDFLPFPVNTPRRVMRYMLRSRGLSPDYVDAFMGHWRERREPWGRWSSFDYRDYLERIQALVPALLQDLGFESEPCLREAD